MKYNRSQIMKQAWEGFKSMRRQGSKTYTFAQALKYAWMTAKKAVEDAAKEASKIAFNGFASFNGFSFKLWEKEVSTNKTIRRIYINSGNSNKGGYIDLTNGIAQIVANGNAAASARSFMNIYKI